MFPDRDKFPHNILSWYDRYQRSFPWRLPSGVQADPYRIWLSEVMLQQTNVTTATPYFIKFTELWPTVADLAAADIDDIMGAWAGLGYYARARNLHKCAQTVVTVHDGTFPSDVTVLSTLPGVGAYTAAAIAAIAFGKSVAAVDGNVERIIARLFVVSDPLPGSRAKLTALAQELVPSERAGDYAQALMDLGATVCTPRNPACTICPVLEFCQGCRQGLAETLPTRVEKATRPTRHGMAFWIMRRDGAVLLRQRVAKGLLGGMMEVPSTPWRDTQWSVEEAAAEAPLPLTWRLLPGLVRHPFTHFVLELTVATARTGARADVRGIWVKLDALSEHALPSVMQKVISHALKRAYEK